MLPSPTSPFAGTSFGTLMSQTFGIYQNSFSNSRIGSANNNQIIMVRMKGKSKTCYFRRLRQKSLGPSLGLAQDLLKIAQDLLWTCGTCSKVAPRS